MKTRIKNAVVATKNHVVRNRGKYAVAGTSLVFMAAMRNQSKMFNSFIERHELTDEWFAELNQG